MDTSKARLLIFQLPFKGNTRRFHQRIFSSNNFSSTSFVFNETRIVLINWYGAIIIKFDTTCTIYISVCVYMGRGNCPSSGLLLSGVVVVRGGVVRGGDVRSPSISLHRFSALLPVSSSILLIRGVTPLGCSLSPANV